jgi:hypothetical protein
VKVPLHSWGASPDEISGAMPGDELIQAPPMNATRSITIAAPPTSVFPWLVQMGFGRAGWYSYDWIDNLGRTSAKAILPQYQLLRSGDPVPGGPIEFNAALVHHPEGHQPGRFVLHYRNRRLQFTLAFEARQDEAGTRLVSRARAKILTPGGTMLARLLEFGDGVMVCRQLVNIRSRAESVEALT